MFFITHRCDPPPPGTFLCENVVTGKEINVNKYGLLSDFYSFSEEKASPKCKFLNFKVSLIIVNTQAYDLKCVFLPFISLFVGEHYKKDETFLKMVRSIGQKFVTL